MAEPTPIDITKLSARRRTRTYDTDKVRDLAEYLAKVLTPTGTVMPTYAQTEPEGDGWKFLNGQTLQKAEFTGLYAAIGDEYGSTADTFTLPDWRGRLPIGAGGIPALNLFDDGGLHEVILGVSQLPSHSHDITDPGHGHEFTGTPHTHTVTDPGHTHTAATPTGAADTRAGSAFTSAPVGSTGNSTTGVTVNSATAGGTVATGTTGVTVLPTGIGAPVPIIPPVMAVNWMIRT